MTNLPTNQNLKQFAAATQRNREPILEILTQVLPAHGDILEIASGTGEHAFFFAPQFFPRQWIPSDINPSSLTSIEAWRQDCPTENLQTPRPLDVSQANWEKAIDNKSITAIVCINMLHISPWQACLRLMSGAGKILADTGILYLYGAFKFQGKHTAPSNENFDRWLRIQNSNWGVRNLDDVVEVAQKYGLQLQQTIPMPANNFSVVFQSCSSAK